MAKEAIAVKRPTLCLRKKSIHEGKAQGLGQCGCLLDCSKVNCGELREFESYSITNSWIIVYRMH